MSSTHYDKDRDQIDFLNIIQILCMQGAYKTFEPMFYNNDVLNSSFIARGQ